jgi:two-component system LytT family response regulator
VAEIGRGASAGGREGASGREGAGGSAGEWASEAAALRVAISGGEAGHNRPWEERLQLFLDEAQTRGRPLERLLVRRGEEATLLRTAEIVWIEAAGNYSRLHTAGDSYLVRGTLSALEARLDPGRFARIHRSHIINLDQVHSLSPWSHGDWLVRLHGGTELMLSRRYRDRLPFDGI